jgi:hypothetical protein
VIPRLVLVAPMRLTLAYLVLLLHSDLLAGLAAK